MSDTLRSPASWMATLAAGLLMAALGALGAASSEHTAKIGELEGCEQVHARQLDRLEKKIDRILERIP